MALHLKDLRVKTPRQQSAFTGAAGQYAVASRLSLLNHTVFFPSVDEGVDIVLGNGLRIQVKCGHMRLTRGMAGRSYTLPLARVKKYRNGKDHDTRREYVDKVDFVVFWAIEDNRFFVIPAAEITCAVWIPSKLDTFRFVGTKKKQVSSRLVRDYEEAWHLLDVDAAIESAEQQVVETV